MRTEQLRRLMCLPTSVLFPRRDALELTAEPADLDAALKTLQEADLPDDERAELAEMSKAAKKSRNPRIMAIAMRQLERAGVLAPDDDDDGDDGNDGDVTPTKPADLIGNPDTLSVDLLKSDGPDPGVAQERFAFDRARRGGMIRADTTFAEWREDQAWRARAEAQARAGRHDRASRADVHDPDAEREAFLKRREGRSRGGKR